MKTKFKLTTNDIIRGIPHDPDRCMLARCIRRTLHAKYVRVYPNQSGAFHARCLIRNSTSIQLSSKLNEAALKFDRVGGPKARKAAIKPFSFCLNIPTCD